MRAAFAPSFLGAGVHNIHHHRNRGEVADKPEHIDHALLAELLHRPPISRVGYALVMHKLGAEVIGDLFVNRHGVGPAPFA